MGGLQLHDSSQQQVQIAQIQELLYKCDYDGARQVLSSLLAQPPREIFVAGVDVLRRTPDLSDVCARFYHKLISLDRTNCVEMLLELCYSFMRKKMYDKALDALAGYVTREPFSSRHEIVGLCGILHYLLWEEGKAGKEAAESQYSHAYEDSSSSDEDIPSSQLLSQQLSQQLSQGMSQSQRGGRKRGRRQKQLSQTDTHHYNSALQFISRAYSMCPSNEAYVAYLAQLYGDVKGNRSVVRSLLEEHITANNTGPAIYSLLISYLNAHFSDEIEEIERLCYDLCVLDPVNSLGFKTLSKLLVHEHTDKGRFAQLAMSRLDYIPNDLYTWEMLNTALTKYHARVQPEWWADVSPWWCRFHMDKGSADRGDPSVEALKKNCASALGGDTNL